MKKHQISLWNLAGGGGLARYGVLAAASPVVSALFALSLQPIVDTGLSGDGVAFGRACLTAAALGAADLLLYHLVRRSRAALVHRTTCGLRLALFRRLLDLAPQHFCAQDSSVHLTRLTHQAPLIGEDVVGSGLDVYRCVWSMAASVAVLATAGWELVGLVLGCALLSAYLPKLLQDRSVQAQQAYLEANRAHLAQARESMENFLPIRLYALWEGQLDRYRRCARQVELRDNAQYGVRLTLDTLVSAISQLSFLLLLAGVTLLVMWGRLSVGYTMAITQLLGTVMAPLELLPGYWLALRTGRRTLSRELDVLEEGRERRGDGILPSPVETLALRGVSFAYPGGQPVLHGVDLTLERGKKYALVGESGCGKSTLARLLLGLLTPTQGSVTADGVDLGQVNPKSLYRAVGYQGQTPTFFSTTLEENILLGRRVAPRAWERLVERVQLGEWLDGLPQGKQTQVEEGGKNLSGGQAQRVALARCLVDHPDFLVLDEVASALDPRTARQLEEMVLGLEGVGVLAVTHRLDPEVLCRYDEVLVLRQGRLVERGRWESLWERQGEAFRLVCAACQHPET